MGYGVRVPPFREHGNGNDALDLLAEFSGFPDSVHDLPEIILIGQGVGVPAGEPLSVFGFELLDLPTGDLLELLAHRFAGFELLAVHQDRVRSVAPASALFVAEEIHLPGDDEWLPVGKFLLPSRHVIEYEFRDVCVVADDYEDRRG